MSLFGIDILTGMQSICVVYIGFSIVYILNMFGGLIINCQIEKSEKFSIGRVLVSFEKVLFCALTLAGIVVATNLMSQGLFEIDKSIAEMVTSVISMGVFALVFAKGFIQVTLHLMDKIKYFFDITDTSKSAELEKINSMDLETLHEFNPDAENNKDAKG